MVKKQKGSDSLPEKMLQTFFAVSAETGQPIMSTMSSSGMPTTHATKNLLASTKKIIKTNSLIIADKEHFTDNLLLSVKNTPHLDILTPVISTSQIKELLKTLNYSRKWAGYAIAETQFVFDKSKEDYRLIAQRCGEVESKYSYKAFITTSNKDAIELLTKNYDQRWSVEEFFRFENEMGLNRAATHNLNIRYGKLALSMIAQASTYQLRTKLKDEYSKWKAEHLATEVLSWADGDIRVKDDTIVVTFYQAPKHINPNDYINLPKILEKENINPRIPWLYNFKLDFRFK